MKETLYQKMFKTPSRWSGAGVILVLLAIFGLLDLISYSLDIKMRGIWNPNSRNQHPLTRKGTVGKLFSGTADDDKELVEYIRDYKIIPPSKEPYHLNNPNAIENSQFGQTKVLDNILNNMTHGFFVEVGAHDGESLSNSLFFERSRNWTGLLIEANPEVFQTLKQKNRKAYSINACLSLTPTAEQLQFISYGFLGRIAIKGQNAGTTIQCVPLYTLLLALGRTQIDLFSLDIEGDELNVLKTIPWDKMQIRLMLVEFPHIKEGKDAVIEYMTDKGYTLLKILEIDLIFAKQDLLNEVQVNVL